MPSNPSHVMSLFWTRFSDTGTNMSQYEEYETEHVVEDNEMAEVDNEMAEVDNDIMYLRGSMIVDSESDDDDDEYDNLVCSNHCQIILLSSDLHNMLIKSVFFFFIYLFIYLG